MQAIHIVSVQDGWRNQTNSLQVHQVFKQLVEYLMVYKILTKLRNSTYIHNLKFGKGNIPVETKNLKTKLNNSKLKNEILGSSSLNE